MQIQENFSLRAYNSFGIAANARYFGGFNSVEQLRELLHIKKTMPAADAGLLVLGGGSNILLTRNYEGWVLKNELKGIELIKEDADHVYVKAAAGENWHQFVQYCIGKNWAGLENLSLIPGNVGASPMQNIGAYGVELADYFWELEAYHIEDDNIRNFSAADCRFGYRESVFKTTYKNQFIILSVIFRLAKHPVLKTSYGAIQQELASMKIDNPGIKDIADAVIKIRQSKLPNISQTGNAGSFFKNPSVSKKQFQQLQSRFAGIVGYPLPGDHVKLAAGWLIEQAGFKGYRIGDAGCYPKQALVLVNYGNATGKEIYNLSQKILDSVAEKFSVLLEREVNII
jgi:UDP-N-acetylmuramate dehydrogenase